MRPKVVAIVPAAGKGRRFGSDEKIFERLRRIPIIIRTLSVLAGSSYIDGIILLVRRKDIGRVRRLLNRYRIRKIVKVLEGGPTRRDSVFNGIRVIDRDIDLILIHDGTRPFLTADIIKESISSAKKFSAVCTAVPAKSTLKSLDSEDFIEHSPDRSRLWEAQTPQVFRRDLIIKAYEKAMRENIKATDDSMLVERLGFKVKTVKGFYRNIKITTPEDFRLAELLCKTKDQR